MEIKFSITLPPEVSTLIMKALSKLDSDSNNDSDPAARSVSTVSTAKPAPVKTTAVGATKPGASKKPGKSAKAEPAPEEPIDIDVELGRVEPEEPTDDEPAGDDDDFAEPAADDDELVSAEEQKELKAALRAHSEKHKSREGAAKILMKYGKTSGDVKRKDLPALFKALGWKA